MKRLAILLALVAAVAGCTIKTGGNSNECPDGQCPAVRPADNRSNPYVAVPPVDLPLALREKNYKGGSCVHASTEMILRWQGMEDLAAWWRQTYAHGEHASGLISKCEKAGLRYAYTVDGDEKFLDWCSRTRRGAVIFFKPSHSICFFGYTADGKQAILLDNNRIHEHEYWEREKFIRAWKGYGGFALTPVYSPAPPRPWL